MHWFDVPSVLCPKSPVCVMRNPGSAGLCTDVPFPMDFRLSSDLGSRMFFFVNSISNRYPDFDSFSFC